MRKPKQLSSRSILRAASYSDKDKAHLEKVLLAVQEEIEADPTKSFKQIRSNVIKRSISQGVPEPKAKELYAAAKDGLNPFDEAKTTIALSRERLEHIIVEGLGSLKAEKFGKDGVSLGEHFSPEVAKAITQAIKTQTDLMKPPDGANVNLTQVNINKEDIGAIDRELQSILVEMPDMAQQIIEAEFVETE